MNTTRFILIRHGESQANLEKRFAGWWDVPLTEKGTLQAKLTAKYVTETYSIDKIYSSHLQRAYNTALEISKITGVEVVKDEALAEIQAGEWEEKTFEELNEKYVDTYAEVWKKDLGKAVCDGGESVSHVGERTYNFLEKIAKENVGKTIVIATHATPIRTVICLMQNIEVKNSVWASNASVTEVTYNDGKWEIVDFSHDEHLSSAKTTLPPNV